MERRFSRYSAPAIAHRLRAADLAWLSVYDAEYSVAPGRAQVMGLKPTRLSAVLTAGRLTPGILAVAQPVQCVASPGTSGHGRAKPLRQIQISAPAPSAHGKHLPAAVFPVGCLSTTLDRVQHLSPISDEWRKMLPAKLSKTSTSTRRAFSNPSR